MNIEKENIPLIPKLYCIRYIEGGCAKNKCTAVKLKNLNLLKIVSKIYGSLKKSIILNPLAKKEISSKDREIILKNGLIVIDCSWKHFFTIKNLDEDVSRKLPPLIAANPVNYGKWEKLSSAEALSAALYITGFRERAILILSKFSWGREFFRINNFEINNIY